MRAPSTILMNVFAAISPNLWTLDNDGDLDVVIHNLDGAPTVLRNDDGAATAGPAVAAASVKVERAGLATRYAQRKLLYRNNRNGTCG